MEVGEDTKEGPSTSTANKKKHVVTGLMPDQIASIVGCVTSTLSQKSIASLSTSIDCRIYNFCVVFLVSLLFRV